MLKVEPLTENLPFIRNDCTRPPRHLMKHIRESLRLFSEKELNGLEAIWLYDEIPDDAGEEFKMMISEGGRTLGFYYLKTESSAPYIVLFINDIYCSLRDFPFCEYTSIPTLCISKTLAHEVAHHLIATRGYALEEGEEVKDQESLANQYAQKHLEKMRTRWRYRFGFWLMLQWAELLYSSGIVYATKHKHCEAADCWYKAWNLNPKLKNVSQWYHLVREKCESGKESRVSSTD